MKHNQIIINSIKKLQSAGPLNLNFKIVVYCSPNWLQYKKKRVVTCLYSNVIVKVEHYYAFCRN